ncbi:MAG: membrane protein insertase YidC [Verrucomicrobiales bacterium]|nr:membrane protein insertase YidC [Verrucomicrobiales bacterium]
MDRKSIIILVISLALLFSWPAIVSRILPPTDAPRSQTNQIGTVTNELSSHPSQSDPRPASSAKVTSVQPAPVTPAGPEETLILEDDNARYTFTSHGGGIKFVELKRYPATIDCRSKNATKMNGLAMLNSRALTPALSLAGGTEIEGDGSFVLTKTPGGLRAEKVLPSGLRVLKEFRLATNYILNATIRLENTSGQPLVVPRHELAIGTATPIGHRDESLYLGFEWYDGENKPKPVDAAWFANKPLGCLPGQPRTEYVAGNSNVVWAAVYNQFFAIIATPVLSAPQIIGHQVPLPPPTDAQLAANSPAQQNVFGYRAALAYPGTTLGPQQQMEHQFDIFAGPKEYFTLSRLPKNVDYVMNFGFFGFFAKALLLSMNAIHTFVPSYGLAIIVITVIIKLVFWPLTTASTRSMKRMAELQPQMKALQEKYKADPAKMNQKLMEFMKEHKVSPLGGCLPMLLQIPVFFAFYRMLQTAIELRGAKFLWACDLSQADTIWVIPGLNFPLNPMPLLMGATMLWQARLTPLSPGMDPVQQKIMKYMPLMFMVFLYNFSAGLTLYWTVQNLLTIAQMKVTRAKDPAAPAKGTPVNPKALAPRKKQ